ncbi:MAG TPA: pyridoxamine 5'-phosphate oxidase family protein [Rugosimonospora sp.]|nr:pyridoxamine 5'-phosphate oxidase family protein [Rugosimonospora sp.]
MGQVYEAIDGRLREFILAQPVFFVGTAPSGVDGHVNISPKGLSGSLAVLDAHRVAYLDYGGSGAETIAHLAENGRIVLMFCAFAGPPKIVRLHGHGTVHHDGAPEFAALLREFPGPQPGLRSVIEVAVARVSDSCGYAVPQMVYASDRDLLPRFWERKSPEEITEYRYRKNRTSIDGLPAVPSG